MTKCFCTTPKAENGRLTVKCRAPKPHFPGALPLTPLGELTATQTPQLVGSGACCRSPRTSPSPRSQPFGPQTSVLWASFHRAAWLDPPITERNDASGSKEFPTTRHRSPAAVQSRQTIEPSTPRRASHLRTAAGPSE